MTVDMNCPFDGDFCMKKQNRFDEYRMAAFDNDCSFEMNWETFDACPTLLHEERAANCARYRRYLFIVNKIKQELANER